MDHFVSEDDLLRFEGWAKYQGVDLVAITPEELKLWQAIFDDVVERRKSTPKVGLMKLQPVPGEKKYAVAIRDGSNLWLTLWVRCSRKGEIFIMIPRGDRDWDPHASYHLDGTFHNKSFRTISGSPQKRQPLTAAFKGSEHLGLYGGHGAKSIGAVYNPNAFDGSVIVDPGLLGPRNGAVGIDLVEAGHEAEWNNDDLSQRFYHNDIYQRQAFPRDGRPSVVLTIQR